MNGERVAELANRLVPYQRKLARWVVAGIGGEGEPELQWASHIILLNEKTNTYTIETVEDYVERICNTGEGQLGTPFQWTYPSGGKGKRIQLKTSTW